MHFYFLVLYLVRLYFIEGSIPMSGGGTVAKWLTLSPHSKNIQGSITRWGQTGAVLPASVWVFLAESKDMQSGQLHLIAR